MEKEFNEALSLIIDQISDEDFDGWLLSGGNPIIICQICQDEEATEQLPNESSLYVCYGCKIAQREVNG